MFTIREVNLTDDGSSFLYSRSMTSVAKARGWWKTGEPFDFTAIYSAGEYGNKFYAGRRMWRAMSLLAPSLRLDANYEAPLLSKPAYPFSVAPDKKVTLAAAMAIHRDTLQGTPYAMDLASGPLGSPARFDTRNPQVPGAWERTIGIYRTDFTYVLQMRPLPLPSTLWFGPHAAYGTAFMPFFQGQPSVPHSHAAPSPLVYDSTTAWWAHRHATNMAYASWHKMSTLISRAQEHFETAGAALQAEYDKKIRSGTSDLRPLYDAAAALATEMTATWTRLPEQMVFAYADGYFNDEKLGPGQVDPADYSAAWLSAVGFNHGPGYGHTEAVELEA